MKVNGDNTVENINLFIHMLDSFPKLVCIGITSGTFFLELADEPNGFHEVFLRSHRSRSLFSAHEHGFKGILLMPLILVRSNDLRRILLT